MISFRAYGIYSYISRNDVLITAESLSEKFKEGREAIRVALKELRDIGVIETKKERIGDRIMTVTRFVEPDSWAPETRLLIQQYEQNSNINLYAYSTVIQLKRLSDERQMEGKNEMEEWHSLGQIDSDPDDMDRLKKKERERKAQEKLEQKQAKAEAQLQKLRDTKAENWTISNAVYEFKTRLVRWNVKPWEGVTQPFATAYAKKRIEYNTDGEIESKMMDLFIGRFAHEKTIHDPEMLWKLFIRDFGSLAKQVRTEVEAYKNFDTIKAEANEKMARLLRGL